MGSFFNGGLRNKPRYERLPLDTFYPTGSTQITRHEDADDNNLLFDLGERRSQNGRLLPSTKNGYDSEEEIEFYKDTRRLRHGRRRQCCGTMPCCLVCLLVVVVIVVIFFSVVYLVGPSVRTPSLGSSKNWTSSTNEYATEAAIRLYDVNLDGVQDVILGAATTSSLENIENEEFCKKIKMEYPCAGLILAFDGRDGTRLWTISTRVEIFAIQCGKLDINGDGHMDCIAAGRMGTLLGFDPIKGVSLWSADPSVTNPHFNFYQGQAVTDLDGDGVKDYVITHGGNTRLKVEDTERPAGRLILLSGKTGKSLGRFLTLPDGHETYSPITLYRRQSGAVYLIFGSGGETIAGSLWSISLRDLYCYVTSSVRCDADHLTHVPPLQNSGYDEPWGTPVQTLPSGAMEIIRSGSSKGLTVPTELVDMNNDGVDDLIVLMYNSTIVVLNGVDLQVIWATGSKFAKLETYSNPAPGYFNDDDTLDLMVRLSVGKWPRFTSTFMYILDGRNGETLWHLEIPSNSAVMSSPLTLQSYGHKDAFLFWVQSLGETGAMGLEPVGHAMGPNGMDSGHPTSTVHPRPRRHGEGEEGGRKEQCLMSMDVFRAQLLLLDRDLALNPLRLASTEAFKYNYTLTDEDRLHLKEDFYSGPGAITTASPDSPMVTPSQSPLSSTNTHTPVTPEDIARHDLHNHSTATHADAATTPEGPEPTADAATTPEGSEPTTDAATTPEGPEPTTDAATTPEGPEPTTDAATTSEGPEPTTEGPELTTDAATTPEGSEPTTDAATTSEGPEPTTDADMPEKPEPSTKAVTTTVGQESSTAASTSEVVEMTTSDHVETSTPATTGSVGDIVGTSTVEPKGGELNSKSTENITPVDTSSETILPTTDLTSEWRESGMAQTSEPPLTSTVEMTENLQQTTTSMALNSDTVETTVESLQTTVGREDSTKETTIVLGTSDMSTSQPVDSISQDTSSYVASTTVPLADTKTATFQPDGAPTPDSDSDKEQETTSELDFGTRLTSESNTGAPTPENTASLSEGNSDPSIVKQPVPSIAVNKTPAKQNVEGSQPADDGAPRRRRRETSGGDLCTVYRPNLFGTGIIGDLDDDGNLDYIYAETHFAQLWDEESSYITSKIRLRIHRLVLNSAIKKRDMVQLDRDKVELSKGITVSHVDREKVDTHFRFLPADRQSWTAFMGKDADGKFKKNNR